MQALPARTALRLPTPVGSAKRLLRHRRAAVLFAMVATQPACSTDPQAPHFSSPDAGMETAGGTGGMPRDAGSGGGAGAVSTGAGGTAGGSGGGDSGGAGSSGGASGTDGGAPDAAAADGGASCAQGFGDCDADPANGCEATLDTSVAHCGACGNACGLGQTCSAGQCATSTGTACTAGAGGKPNIVVVMADDLDVASFDLMVANGLLPNIESHILDRGTRFTESFVANSLCCPSRATFLTGEYSHNNKTLTNNNGFGQFTPHENDTLATHMKAAGYRTAWMGKYLNGYTNGSYHAPGWDEWQALIDPTSYRMWGFSISRSIDGASATTVQYSGGSTAESASNYQTDVLRDLGVAFIDDAVTTQRLPFLLVEMPLAPHVEALPGQPIDGQSDLRALRVRPAVRHDGTLRAGDDFTPISATFDLPHKAAISFNESDISDKPSWLQSGPMSWGSMGSTDLRNMTRQHLDRLESLLALDEMVGAIWDKLVEHGIEDETVLIFSSDNGYMLGEHRLLNKMFPYEESVRVPLIASCNAGTSAVDARYVSNIDLAPTILDYAGAPWDVDGRSWRPLLEGHAPSSWRKRLLVEHWIDANSPFPWQDLPDMAMVRTAADDASPEHSYIGYYGVSGKLDQSSTATENEQYDNSADPYQASSVAADGSYAAQRTDLAPKLQALRLCAKASCRAAED